MFLVVSLSGFDLCEVGQEEVVLKTGKQASRRIMHFALQSLLALFGENSAFFSNVTSTESFLLYNLIFGITLSSFRLH